MGFFQKHRNSIGASIGTLLLCCSTFAITHANANSDQELLKSSDSISENQVESEDERKIRKDINTKKEIMIEKCAPISRLTTYPVKYIEGNLYLDSRGYKVLPCSKDKITRFSVIDKYEDGEKIYEESKNPILNTDGLNANIDSKKQSKYYGPNIHLNIDESYKITYGSEGYELNDVESFQKQLNLIKLNDANNGNYANNSETEKYSPDLDEKNYADFSSFFIVTDAMKELPEEYFKLIDKEKQAETSKNYQEILANIEKYKQENTASLEKEFEDTAIRDNRLFILPNGRITKVINQYLVDIDYNPGEKAKLESLKDEKGNTILADDVAQNHDINGNLFHFYKINKIKQQFALAAKQFITEYIASPDISLDEKLAVTHYISQNKNFFTEASDAYYNKKNEEWKNLFTNQNKLNSMGSQEYKEASAEEKAEYNRLALEINKEIIEKEFQELPDTITRAQYQSLSNLDKYKYIPQQDGGYINKKIYEKNSIEKVLQFTVEE